MGFEISPEQVQTYQEQGYIIVPSLFTEEEIEKLYKVAMEDQVMAQHAYDLNDQTGKKTKLTLWFTPGNDIYGLLTRSKRIVETVDSLMDGDSLVCHFHSKLMQKQPKTGGAWEWHQDYGYWYKNEFLFPEQMCSVMVALTEANKANGCLQVIPGSHKMGRIEHGFSGEQVGASMRYVELALKEMPLVYVELKPGDTLFFHPNILHRSEANLSDKARWSLISVYNRQNNKPYNETSTSCISPIEMVPDDAFMYIVPEKITDNASFLVKEEDVTLKNN
ncbi:phytanoyl-CoA dioxygenase family protein [Pollutibacter soli]|uniref:phytanoyl-CoA dioxygenase family protein n=1 Tax=Pollutibacter soli TaxID=3034157 RepID=UPI0030139C9C